MSRPVDNSIRPNTFEYLEKTKITDNGFREYDVRWLVGDEINANGFQLLGMAYGTFMKSDLDESCVVVGHDYRAYSQDLTNALIVGLLSTGAEVVDIGLAITPMVYFAQHLVGTKASVMVTASHNENGWTGAKLGEELSLTLGPKGIARLKAIADQGEFASGKGSYKSMRIDEEYAENILEQFEQIKPLRVVLAAGNGTAGRFAPDILRRLGCDLTELDCNADWNFPKHNPNPEDAAFLKHIAETVVSGGYDLGIGMDGDGDRIGIIDEKGKEVYGDKLGLLVARELAKDHPNRKIVVDVKSTGLFHDDEVLARENIEVVTWITGHSYMKHKVAEQNALAGFEKSGHWFFSNPIYKGYDDAIYSAALLLSMLSRGSEPLSKRLAELPRTWQSPTLGVYCSDDSKYDVVAEAVGHFEGVQTRGEEIAGSKVDSLITVNGVRFVFADGSWGLVRASSNKPSLVLVTESRRSDEHMRAIMEYIRNLLAEKGIDEYDQEM